MFCGRPDISNKPRFIVVPMIVTKRVRTRKVFLFNLLETPQIKAETPGRIKVLIQIELFAAAIFWQG
jgi:hypothetical protein